MKWHEIRIKTTEEATDALSEMLTSIGAGGVAIEDPNDIRREIEKPNTLDYADPEFLEGLGDKVTIKAYFHGDLNLAELCALINEKIAFVSQFLNTGDGLESTGEVDDEDWANSWRKYYKPFKISQKVAIKPSWEDYQGEEGDVVIEMDPGMAFGTGTHETTRLCAGFLEKNVKNGDKVLDLGCGTAILAVIAAKLGAADITAVDIDEVAVKVSKENAEINNVSQKISVLKGELGTIEKKKYNLIVANIIANVIIDISENVSKFLENDGLFITSGIIRERKQEILDTYKALGFECLEVQEMGEWVAILFKWQGSL